MSERLFLCDLFHFTDEHLAVFRNFKTCKSSDFIRALSYNISIESTVFENDLSYCLGFFRTQKIGATI